LEKMCLDVLVGMIRAAGAFEVRLSTVMCSNWYLNKAYKEFNGFIKCY